MMRLTVFLLTFCAITPAFALHCKNDYAGSAGCAANSTPAGDCTTLGFSKSDVAGCSQYLYCMFDTSYKRCISKSDTTCPTGYGKVVYDCGNYPPGNGWTLGTLNSSGCGKCIKKSCPSGSATMAAGCASGVITNEFAGAYSGDDPCVVCQPVSTTCSDGYARDIKGCSSAWNGSGYKLDATQKDAAGCSKCVAKKCSDYGYSNDYNIIDDGYHLCKKQYDIVLGDDKVWCPDCVPCSEATICPKTFGPCSWRLRSTNRDIYFDDMQICKPMKQDDSLNGPLVTRVLYSGPFKDNDERTATGCYAISVTGWGGLTSNAEIVGCCRDGQTDLTLNNEVFPGMGMTIDKTTCPPR